MKTMLIAVSISLTLTGYIAAQKPKDLTEKEAAANRARPYVEGLAALKRYREAKEGAKADTEKVLSKIKTIEESLRLWWRIKSFPKYTEEAQGRHLELSFALAEEALKKKHKALASHVYKRIIVFYTGHNAPKVLKRATRGFMSTRPKPTKGESASRTPDVAAKTGSKMIPVTIFNKRFEPTDISVGRYESNLWWDAFYDFAQLPRKARAVKGQLLLQDLFGETKLKVGLTITNPIMAHGFTVAKGVGITYNQFKPSHVWLRSTNVKDMRVVFHMSKVIYAEGLSSPSK